MKKIIIVAMTQDRAIGKEGDIPWHYPEDLKHFKETTLGFPVIMGRKTYESFPESVKPLPKRQNIVLTRSPEKIEQEENLEIAKNLKNAFKIAKKTNKNKLFIIGGENVYKQTLDDADELIITKIPESVDGDSHFPEFNRSQWDLYRKKQLEELEVQYWQKS